MAAVCETHSQSCFPDFFGPFTDPVTEHLATQMGQDVSAAEQFKNAFIKAHNSLGHLQRSMDSSKQNGRLKSKDFLKPKYTCLTCGESMPMGGRKAHTEKTSHQFCR